MDLTSGADATNGSRDARARTRRGVFHNWGATTNSVVTCSSDEVGAGNVGEVLKASYNATLLNILLEASYNATARSSPTISVSLVLS